MAVRSTILVQAEIQDRAWTASSSAAIEQAGMLAEHSQSKLHLMTRLKKSAAIVEDLRDSDESPLTADQAVLKLQAGVTESLLRHGVKVTAALQRDSNDGSGPPTPQPAPVHLVFLGLPDRESEQDSVNLQQILAECHADLWLAAPHAFDRDIPCMVVYDDLGPAGDLALRAAVSAAQNFQARLLVVHALPPGRNDDAIHTAETELQSRLFTTDFRTLDQGTRLFVQSGPVEEVLERAIREFQAALVICSWPSGPIHSANLLDFTKQLSRASCSLLLVRTPDSLETAACA